MAAIPSRMPRCVVGVAGFLAAQTGTIEQPGVKPAPAYFGHPAAAAGASTTAALTLIPGEGSTVLPPYIPPPAKPHPLPPPQVPQNRFLAPNPFNYVHNDPWMSDTYDVAGPLGRAPEVLTSTLVDARFDPASFAYVCGGLMFDSLGRLVMSCGEPGHWGLALVAPESLEVLAHANLGGTYEMNKIVATGYVFLDNHDRVVLPSFENKIQVRTTSATPEHPAFHPRFRSPRF